MTPSVLLIDDNEIQLMTRRIILRQAGYHVHAAHSAAEALALVEDTDLAGNLRLVITDHLMPGMRGDAFIRELRKTMPDVPVLVITGLPDADVAYEGLHAEFLPKPCHPEMLIEAAAKYFSGPMTLTA